MNIKITSIILFGIFFINSINVGGLLKDNFSDNSITINNELQKKRLVRRSKWS